MIFLRNLLQINILYSVNKWAQIIIIMYVSIYVYIYNNTYVYMYVNSNILY